VKGLLGVKLDARLVEHACGGDDAAAAELIGDVWPDAYRIAWSVLNDRVAAEDAAQEACARAWRKLPSLRRPERFAVWFYRIVVNESKRIAQSARREAASDGNARKLDETPLDDRIALRAAVSALEPHLRLPIVLRYYYGLRSRQIAEIVGTSAVTIRCRLMLAHRRLRRELDDSAILVDSNTSSDGRYTDESIAANRTYRPSV
jgi:RNA polymerase sigma factor (sigma-70 family)